MALIRTERLEGEEVIEGPRFRYVIREFRLEDLSRVVYINRAVLPENYHEYFFVEHHRTYPKAFLVAEVDGTVIGYVMGRVEYGWSNFKRGVPVRKGHVVSIGVLPEYRRNGVATNLLARQLRVFRDVYGASEAYLEVRVSNVAAQSLYAKLGFTVVGTIRGYYLDGEDAYVMAVDLSNALR